MFKKYYTCNKMMYLSYCYSEICYLRHIVRTLVFFSFDFIAKSVEFSLSFHPFAESHAEMFTINAHAVLNKRLASKVYCVGLLKLLILAKI